VEFGATANQVAEMRRLVAAGYLQTVEGLAKRLSAPFWWRDPDLPAGQQLQGGTICFLHTGARLIGVTAAHVHLAFLNARDAHPELACQIGGQRFDPESRCIALDQRLDVATYGLSELQVNAVPADIHYAPKWPPEVDLNDAYVIGGWPWSLIRESEAENSHAFLHFIGKLSSASANQLGAVTYTARSIPWGDEPLPLGTNLGGMSGGPMYRMSESGLATLTLVGTIFEYHKDFEIVLARPLSLLDEEGNIAAGGA
jgi:hypothetical protein